MHPRRAICYLLLLTGLMTGCTRNIPDEPSYAGKTVNQWLNAGYEDSAMALQQIGAGAVPYVLAKLSHEDPHYGTSRHYRAFWLKLPANARRILPKPRPATFDELRATSTLLEFGPAIVPLLSNNLKDRNPGVRLVCARTLATFRQQGCNIHQAIPALVLAARDSNPDVAASARSALGGEPAALVFRR